MHHMYHPYVWVEGLLPTTNARQRDDSHLPAVPLAHWSDSPRKTSGPAHTHRCTPTLTSVRFARASLDDAVPRSIERPTAV